MPVLPQKQDCCGCSACGLVCSRQAITISTDSEGFKYPILNLSLCIECKCCEKVCPIIHRDNTERKKSYKFIYAVQHKNMETLFYSSSGGAFSAIAEYVFSCGGAVVGVEYSETMEVRHAFAYSMKEAGRFRGSKYVQSNLGRIFQDIKSYLGSGKLLLFTGTPCQVQALKLYLRKSYSNLITVDLICHAVPSPLYFEQYVIFLNRIFGKQLTSIMMRDKATAGWSHKYSYRYSFIDGTDIVDPSKVSNWGRIFFSQLLNRPSCYKCRFTNLDRVGDITIADYWDDSNKRTDIYSSKGMSLFFVNSEVGVMILNSIKENLRMWQLSEEEAMQPCLQYPPSVSPKRNEFWQYYHTYGFQKSYMRYFTDPIYVRIKKMIKIYLKSLLRRNIRI